MLRKVPKGKLILVGGGEDKGKKFDSEASKNRKFERLEILKLFLPKKGHKGKIEIITTASNVSQEIIEMYEEAFAEIGVRNLGFINIVNHEEAADRDLIKRVKKAHAVFFSGGDQFRLSTILGNTAFLETIHKRYFEDSDFLVGGTSAGAMAAGVLMMMESENNEALLKGEVKISSGLGFIDGYLVDTHFMKRGRFGRLSLAVVMNPTCVGIGLGEDTAVVIKKGNEAECFGSGMVTIIDGKDVNHTNIAYAEESTPVCIQGLKVHILGKGNKFILDTREFIPAVEDLKMENKSRGDL